MIKIIAGIKGSGKTKSIIDQANKAVAIEKGNIVFIEKSKELMYDLNKDIRLIDASEYKVSNYDKFMGFVNGITAANYDITHIFVDGLFKIDKTEDAALFDNFIKSIEDIAKRTEVKFTITASIDPALLLDSAKKYL